jgi:hypothetical protein
MKIFRAWRENKEKQEEHYKRVEALLLEIRNRLIDIDFFLVHKKTMLQKINEEYKNIGKKKK